MLCCKNTDAKSLSVEFKCKLKICCKSYYLPGVKVLSQCESLYSNKASHCQIHYDSSLYRLLICPSSHFLLAESLFGFLISFMPSKVSGGDIRRLSCMRQRFPPAVSKWACWSSQFQKGHWREDTFSVPSSVFSTKQPLENSLIIVHLLHQQSRFYYSSPEDKRST